VVLAALLPLAWVLGIAALVAVLQSLAGSLWIVVNPVASSCWHLAVANLVVVVFRLAQEIPTAAPAVLCHSRGALAPQAVGCA